MVPSQSHPRKRPTGCKRASRGTSHLCCWESRALGLPSLFSPWWRSQHTLVRVCLEWRQSQRSEIQQRQGPEAFYLVAGPYPSSRQETGEKLMMGSAPHLPAGGEGAHITHRVPLGLRVGAGAELTQHPGPHPALGEPGCLKPHCCSPGCPLRVLPVKESESAFPPPPSLTMQLLPWPDSQSLSTNR